MRSSLFLENITKSHWLHYQKILFLSSRWWTQQHFVKNDKNLLAKLYTNIRYWAYSLCLRTFRNHIKLSNKSAFFFQFEDELDIWSKTLNLRKYLNHLSCSRIFKKYICLSIKLIFFSNLDDDFNIRWAWNLQLDILLQLIWRWTVQSHRKLSSTFSAMLTSLLRVKIARFVDNRFYWFCQFMIRRSTQIHLITRFQYRFDEDIFF